MRILSIVISLFFTTTIFGQIKGVQYLDHFDDPELWPTGDGESVFNEVWGFVQDGAEYAVMGGTIGTYIFKVTDDDQVKLRQFILGSHYGTDVVHRDYHDHNGYLYEVCDEGSSTLRIYDLQYLPDSVHIVYDDSSLIIRSHNIFIDTSSSLLYSCGSTSQLGLDAMRVISIADPVNPVVVYDYNFVDYVHDVYVRNDTAYMNCAEEGLRVANFANPTMPLPLGSMEFYTDKGYNHSGWLSEDGKTYVMCDETVGSRFKVVDVSDLSDINVIALDKPETFDETVPHNVMVKDGLAYFSYYNDGLQIYDIREPSNPKQIAYYDTYGNPDTGLNVFRGAWGIYSFLPSGRLLVSDRMNGLFLLDYTPPLDINVDPGEFGIYPNPVNGNAVFYYYQNHNSDYTVQVFDMLGKLVGEFDGFNDQLDLDLNHLSAGTYTFRYENHITSKILVDKFIVVK